MINTKSHKLQPCCTLDITGHEQRTYVEMLKAISNPIRFKIMKFILTHPGCNTGEVVDHLPIAQATVSQHLNLLNEAGWITVCAEGVRTTYCLNEKKVGWFKAKTNKIF